MTKIAHEVGSGNVFADLGVPDPDVHLLKSRLVGALAKMIKQQGLTQAEAAERMQMAQPDVSRLLKGQFRAYSVERILRCIAAFGSDVRITISGTEGRTGRRKPGKIVVLETA